MFSLPENINYIEAEYIPYHIKAIPLLFSHFGIYLAYTVSSVAIAGDQRYISAYVNEKFGISAYATKFFANC